MQGNLIELHSHVLPQFDDGSESVEMSVAMLRRMAEQGISTVCATSHYYRQQNSIETFCARLLVNLPEGLPRILPAAEVAFFSGISEKPDLGRLCIQGTRTLMLEMPFSDWTDLQEEEVSALVLDRGFNVVLVHPERFCSSKGNRQKLRQLEELPVGLQVNAGTLLHWMDRRVGLNLLRETPIPLLGSDCHNLTTRPPNLKEGRKIVIQKLGSAFLDKMDGNAADLIRQTADATT